MHLFEEEWMRGLREGMEGLFEIKDDDEAAEESDSSTTEDDEEEHEEEEEEDEDGDESDWEAIEGFEINDMGASLFDRSKQFAQYWIRKNEFAILLRHIGKERVRKLGRLRITWGGWEAIRTGEMQRPGPYAVGLMSIVCSLFLPNLKYIELQQTAFNPGEENTYHYIRFGVDHNAEGEAAYWPDSLKLEVMGPGEADKQRKEDGEETEEEAEDEPEGEQAYMIKAVRLIIDACENLKELRLQDWKTMGRAQWWRELLEKDGLAVKVWP